MDNKLEKSYFVPAFMALVNSGFHLDASFAFNALVEEYQERSKSDKDLHSELLGLFKQYEKNRKLNEKGEKKVKRKKKD